MWVSKKQWDALVARVDHEESMRHEAWRRIAELTEAVRKAKADVAGAKDLLSLAERVSKVEKQVIPPGIVGVSGMLDTYLFGPRPAPTALYQKVNLLLDHLKLRVQPEGTTPVALVKKTGAK